MFVLLVYFNSVILFIVRLMFLSGFMLKIQNSLLHSYLRSLPSWKMMAAYRVCSSLTIEIQLVNVLS
ncbi:hypothetical protein Hdeb2414_s0027g00692971 [Helianthus debilis subsp. tardiflorus]